MGGVGIWNPTSLYDWLVVLLALKCTKQHKSNYFICWIVQNLFIDSLVLHVFLKVYKVIQTWLRNSKLETRNSCVSICPRPSHTHTHTHNICLTHAWLLCYSLLRHWWMGKWVCLHIKHTHRGGGTQQLVWTLNTKSKQQVINIWRASTRVAQQNFPKKPQWEECQSVFSRCVNALNPGFHYLSFPVSALAFLCWEKFINQIQLFDAVWHWTIRLYVGKRWLRGNAWSWNSDFEKGINPAFY